MEKASESPPSTKEKIGTGLIIAGLVGGALLVHEAMLAGSNSPGAVLFNPNASKKDTVIFGAIYATAVALTYGLYHYGSKNPAHPDRDKLAQQLTAVDRVRA